MQALVTRGSLTGSDSSVNLGELTRVLTAGMVDHHPGVRAFAFKAAWHWWVWNPEMRKPINRAWLDALTREEPEAQVDMAFRYSTISLFVVNGQVNNITGGKYLAQQYPELADFYRELAAWREQAPPEKRRLLDRRLAAMAASHYMERANQQSPGQFAYSTPGATELFGKALRQLISDGEGQSADPRVRRLQASDEFVADMLHFRDYAFAEMNKINPSDNRACISCHGVPGRVPTLYLHPLDGAGYIPAAELFANYRKMQQRVDLGNPEDSKFLRKPLNIQSGQEDGHQGGQRYEASDPGFQVIRNWVVQQAKLQQGLGGAETSEGR